MYDSRIGRFLQEDPEGFEAGDANLYRYVNNSPTMATDPSGLEWHHVILQSLWNPARANPLPFSEVARAIFDMRGVGVIDAPGHVGASGHGAYNAAVRAEVNAWLTANRIRPERMTGAQARQLVQHIRNSPTPAIRSFFTRILAGSASTAATAAGRTAATATARTARARTGIKTLGTVARLAFGPFSVALSEIFVSPSSTASAGQIPENTLMRPPSSPDIYPLPLGTIIVPTGQIYLPGSGSTFVPPPGSVVVIGHVIGNGLRPGERFRTDQVAPFFSQDFADEPDSGPMQ